MADSRRPSDVKTITIYYQYAKIDIEFVTYRGDSLERSVWISVYYQDAFLNTTCIGPAFALDFAQVLPLLRKQNPELRNFIIKKIIEAQQYWDIECYWEKVVPIFYE